VASLKRHYHDQPDQLMKWVHATVTLAEMSKVRSVCVFFFVINEI
jgi:hypothetical protein